MKDRAVLAAVLIAACIPVHAELPDMGQPAQHDIVVPALIGLGTVAIMRTPYLNSRCDQQPCNAASHMAVGGLVAAYVDHEYGFWPAVGTVLLVAVGKEVADKHYDPHDAEATIAGGAAVLMLKHTWRW